MHSKNNPDISLIHDPLTPNTPSNPICPRVLVTAGPTHEPIDRVRYIANRSSGRLGVALAGACQGLGWPCVLLLGPVGDAAVTALPKQTPPANAGGQRAADSSVRVERFQSAADLQALLERHARTCDILIMAAAVADFRPASPHPVKLPRTPEALTIALEPVPDLLAATTPQMSPGSVAIGFALEQSLSDLDRARAKLARKGCDAIVLNPLDTMDSGQIDATILFAQGRPPLALGPLDKADFSTHLLTIANALWEAKARNAP